MEVVFTKANSYSPELHGITLRLREEDMKVYLIVHVIHVAGTRMKELGIDGLSIGDFLEGVMAGKMPLEILPLDFLALEREGGIKKWIRNW